MGWMKKSKAEEAMAAYYPEIHPVSSRAMQWHEDQMIDALRSAQYRLGRLITLCEEGKTVQAARELVDGAGASGPAHSHMARAIARAGYLLGFIDSLPAVSAAVADVRATTTEETV